MTIELPEKLMSQLLDGAKKEGMSLEEYLETASLYMSSSSKIEEDTQDDIPKLVIKE